MYTRVVALSNCCKTHTALQLGGLQGVKWVSAYPPNLASHFHPLFSFFLMGARRQRPSILKQLHMGKLRMRLHVLRGKAQKLPEKTPQMIVTEAGYNSQAKQNHKKTANCE